MHHDSYIYAIIVIVIIFVFVLLGVLAMKKETFKNPGSLPRHYKNFKNKHFVDTLVPQNLGYTNLTPYYNQIDNGLKGTSLVNVSSIDSGRYPIMIETPTNWYNTQGLILKKTKFGTNEGKLPQSDCFCNEKSLLFQS